MSDSIKIEAEKRNESENPRELRKNGLLPATISGKKLGSISIQLNGKNFISRYKSNKEETYDIVIGKDAYNVKVVSIQKNYSTGKELHVEFKLV